MDIYEYYGIPIRPVNFQISTHTTLESLFGIWNLSQKTMGFRILHRNFVGARPFV